MEAIRLNPALHRAHYGLGLVYLQTGKPDQAEKSFRSALTIQPDYAPAFRGLGQLYEMKNDLSNAVLSYQKALSLEKVNPAFAGDAAFARTRLSQIGDTPETALKAYDHQQRAKSFLKEKKNQEALKEFLLVLDLVPQNLNSLENAAVILSELGRLEESAVYLHQIIAINPDGILAHFLLGLIDETLEKTGEAWEAFHTVVTLGKKAPLLDEVVKSKEKIGQLGPSREEAVEIARKIKEAFSLYDQKKMEEAGKIFLEVLPKAPENARAKFGLGLIDLSKGKETEAKKWFLEVIGTDPEQLLAHFLLGEIYLKEKEIPRAFEALKRVQELGVKPGNPEKFKREIENAGKDLAQFGNDLARGVEIARLLNEGKEWVKKENLEAAKEKFNRVLSLVPFNLEALGNLGSIYMRETSLEPQKAREMFEKMVSADPDLLAPRLRLGGLYENQGNFEKAMAMYREVLTRDAKEGEFAAAAKKRLRQLGETPEKARLLEGLLKEGEKSVNEKRPEEAMEIFQKALEIVPDRIEALYLLGLILVQKREVEKAEKHFRAILAVDPDNLASHLQLGLLLGAKGRYQDAVKELEAVVSIGKEGKMVEIARTELEGMKKKGEAEIHFNIGLDLLTRIEEIQKKGPFKPDDPLAAEKKGLVKKAIEELTASIKFNQDNPYYYYNLGVAFVYQFDLVTAELVFKKAIEKKPDLMQAHYQLAIMYEAAGAYDAALKEFEAVISSGKEEEKEVQEARSKIEGLKGHIAVNEEAKGYALVANFLFLERKETDKAGPLFLKATELDPHNGDYWYNLGIYEEAVSDQKNAEAAYRKAIESAPNFSIPYFYLGLILEKKGEVREAYEDFRKAKQFEVSKNSKEAVLTEARLQFYEQKLKGSFSVSPFNYDNNPGNLNQSASDYSVSGSYSLNLKYFYLKSPRALLSSSLNISNSIYYYSQFIYNSDNLSIEGYWPDVEGIDLSASSSLGMSAGYGGTYGWSSNSTADFKAKIIGFDTLTTHIGYLYSISTLNPFYDSTRLNLNWIFVKEHLGKGSLSTVFGVNHLDVAAQDDSNVGWTGSLNYSQPLAGYLTGSLGLTYGESYFTNPDSVAQQEGLGVFYRKNKTYMVSASFSYPLFKDLSVSLQGGWQRVDSNVPTLVPRNIQDVLAQLTSPIGSYSKMTFGTAISYSF